MVARIICGVCKKVHETDQGHCPVCGPDSQLTFDFKNSDEFLESEVLRVFQDRKSTGLDILLQPRNRAEQCRFSGSYGNACSSYGKG